LPALKILAIEDRRKSFAALGRENLVGLVAADLAHEKIAPADFAPVVLELKSGRAQDGEALVERLFLCRSNSRGWA